jgi:hypothetical protein
MAFDSFRDFVNVLDQAGELKCMGVSMGAESVAGTNALLSARKFYARVKAQSWLTFYDQRLQSGV